MEKSKRVVLFILTVVIFSVLVVTVFINSMKMGSYNMDGMDMDSDEDIDKAPMVTGEKVTENSFKVLTGNEFTITAEQGLLQIDNQTMKEVWTFNGSVPGPQIRVKKGEKIKVVLNNELPEPVTIHWHGLPVENSQDGIPGITMNAIQPGESFTYQFTTDVPGTYWYHSHQNGVKQVDMGLYGSLVVEDDSELKVDRDYTVVLDEWIPDDSSMPGMNMGTNSESKIDAPDENGDADSDSASEGGMDKNMDMNGDSSASDSDMDKNLDSDPAMNDLSESEMMPLLYSIYTANGKAGSAIEPLMVKEGEKVRIRIVNAGFISHQLHLQGHEFKIVSTDGQPINNPGTVKDQLVNIAPGERYDIEFIADNPGKWLLDEHSVNPGAEDMTIPIIYEGVSGQDVKNDNQDMPLLDITKYGEASTSEFSLDDKYDVEYTMDLNTSGEEFTINDEVFPNTPPINVEKGDLVKVKLVNNSPKDIHPMHLHGHFFQVLSKNGQPVSGSPLIKDTINLLPGEEYVVAFKADNPGDWLFHCHDLGHAAQGMVTLVKYDGFEPAFEVDPDANNQPE